MPAVQSISRFEFIIGQTSNQTVGAAAVSLSTFTWVDRLGNAINWANPAGAPPYQLNNCLSARCQIAQGWRLTVLSTGTVFWNHGSAPTTAAFENSLANGAGTYETLEGIQLISSLQFIASGAAVQIKLEILG